MKSQILFRISCVVLFSLVSAQEVFARTRSHSSSGSGPSGWVIFIGFALLFGGIFRLSIRQDKKRTEKTQAVTSRLGFTFRRKATDADNALIVGCQVAKSGHSHSSSYIIEAANSDELKLTLFDHSYSIGVGKSRRRYDQTITRMQSPVLNLPAFTMFPETFGSKIGKLFGGADINFPEAPQFSQKYILRGPDEAAIRSLFSPALVQFLEQKDKLSLDGSGDTLFAFRTGYGAGPDQIEAYVTEGKQILAKFFEAQNAGRSVAPPPLPPPVLA